MFIPKTQICKNKLFFCDIVFSTSTCTRRHEEEWAQMGKILMSPIKDIFVLSTSKLSRCFHLSEETTEWNLPSCVMAGSVYD